MIDRRIKFRHIQCFVEIARERSFKRAAAKLFLTQPAISKTLRELEGILGTQLMTRNRSGVSLTKHGDVFLHFARMSLASLQQGMDGIEHEGELAQATLSIGLWPSVAAWFMPAVATEFTSLAPNAVLRIIDGPHNFLIDHLRHGELDMVVGQLGEPDTMQGITFTQVYNERLAIVVRVGHPILSDPDLSRIGEWQVIYPPKEAAIRPLVERLMIAQGVGHIPKKLEAVSRSFGLVYTLQSDAIWITMHGVVANEIADGKLIELPFEASIAQGPVGLMSRPEAVPTPLAQIFQIAAKKASAGDRLRSSGQPRGANPKSS